MWNKKKFVSVLFETFTFLFLFVFSINFTVSSPNDCVWDKKLLRLFIENSIKYIWLTHTAHLRFNFPLFSKIINYSKKLHFCFSKNRFQYCYPSIYLHFPVLQIHTQYLLLSSFIKFIYFLLLTIIICSDKMYSHTNTKF